MVRGDVHAIRLPSGRGRGQQGRRSAVVVQADDLLALSTVVVCPTSQSTPAASFHPQISIGDETTRVMCEMVSVVDVHLLGDQVGHISREGLLDVDEALRLVLDLG